MIKADLERITDGMAQGSGEFAVEDADGNERAYNLVGAINAMTNVLDTMEEYGLSYSDLPTEDQEALDHGQQALQYYEDQLRSLLASFTGNDGTLEDENGNAVADLPEQATAAGKTGDLPDVAQQ